MATEAFEKNFLYRREEIAIRLTQLTHRPANVHERAIGQARIVDARDEIGQVVCVFWGGFGGAGECSNEGLRGDRCRVAKADELAPTKRMREGRPAKIRAQRVLDQQQRHAARGRKATSWFCQRPGRAAVLL